MIATMARSSLILLSSLTSVALLGIDGGAGCGKATSTDKAPAAGSGATTATGSGGSAAGSGATAAPTVDAGAGRAANAKPSAPPAAAVTKEARATYRKQLDAGRKLAKATKWPEAIAAFEAALVAVPGDDRALSELSFAAMNAGDAAKARDAGKRAVLAATEPKIKAAALYNLGRVEELQQPSLAATLYRQSLALRPNKIVEKRLADLAKTVPAAATPEPLPCTTPVSKDALCTCLGETTELAPDERRCEVADTSVAGLATATFATSEMGEETVALVAGSGDKWQVVAILTTIYNPGAFGISEEWSLGDVTARDVGGHQVIEVRSSWSRNDSDMGINEVEGEGRDLVTVCVRAKAGDVPTCPLTTTLHYTYDRDTLMDDLPADEQADMAPYKTPGLPIKNAWKVSLEIGDDGVAHLRAVEGRVDGALLGDRKLW